MTHAVSNLRPPLLLFLLGLALGGGVIRGWEWEGLYGQDAFAYYGYALGPLRAALAEGAAPPPFFWPLGYPLLALATALVAGPRGPQLASLVAGALVPPLTWGMAWEAARALALPLPRVRRVALLAGLLALCCGLLLQAATVVMADAAALAWAALAGWALLRYGRAGREAWLALAALGLACAILTRWAYGLLVPAFAAYGAATVWQMGAAGRWRRLVAHGGGALLIGAVVVGGPILMTATPAPSGESAFLGDLEVYSWSPLNALRRDFVTPDGRLVHPIPSGLFYASAIARPPYFTPLLAPGVLLGLWLLWRRRAAREALLLVGWPAGCYLFLAGVAWQNIRFTLAYLPPLAALIALGADAMLAGRWRWQPLARLWLVLGLALMLGGALRNIALFVGQMQGYVAAARWVAAQVPPDAQLLSFGLTATLDHYTSLPVQDLFSLPPERLAATSAPGATTFVFVDVASLEGQWAGRTPEQALRWLRAGPGLVEVGRWGSYTLFRVVAR